jgi:hypothetical protein
MASNAVSQIFEGSHVASSRFLAAQDVTRKHSLAIVVHVGLVGFEPTASWSRTRRDTKLRYSPKGIITFVRGDAPLTSRILVQIARRSIRVRAPVVETTGILHI